MRIAVLAATGATGRHLVTQALARGHDVVALARNPDRLDLPASPRLHPVAADVTDPPSLTPGLSGADAVVSALGRVEGSPDDILTTGARALAAARASGPVPRVVWLSAFGTGGSARPAGPLTRALLRTVLGGEVSDKAGADALLLPLGASVVHAGPLTNGPLSPARTTVALDDVPRRLLPRTVSRATVAAAMLDEARHPCHAGRVAVPLT
ncbi:NAD(P)-dependent oxidoreductase [Quadrisphaera sp. DSM 44207]|uniref:NAD(P)-dependent oxidoreductase n=1 Tax=Quadrisphaera sp. DSM 44207 TaxID=1881057 RepID=UPI00088739D4|nr:NAD(P)-binding oxidoreductase [Quadrisphaera sp. DSM 44207]SDQ89460.1 hypothetical protein SAMN05428996_3058 [Quadrisphaera sp. DSM 44207]